jgi:hypothetical protein
MHCPALYLSCRGSPRENQWGQGCLSLSKPDRPAFAAEEIALVDTVFNHFRGRTATEISKAPDKEIPKGGLRGVMREERLDRSKGATGACCGTAEVEAIRRARDGTPRPVFRRGVKIGDVTKLPFFSLLKPVSSIDHAAQFEDNVG